jgi:DNA-binding MarR family transcriptional regulator
MEIISFIEDPETIKTILAHLRLAVRGESRAWHRGWRCARRPRRDEREYVLYLTEEQRRPTRCSASRMQRDFHHGLPGDTAARPPPAAVALPDTACDYKFFEGLVR